MIPAFAAAWIAAYAVCSAFVASLRALACASVCSNSVSRCVLVEPGQCSRTSFLQRSRPSTAACNSA